MCTVFWDGTLYSVVDRYQCFGVTFCLHHQNSTPTWRQDVPLNRYMCTKVHGVQEGWRLNILLIISAQRMVGLDGRSALTTGNQANEIQGDQERN
jgi:hypothetical protein